MDLDLKNKVVFVSGSTRGIGRAIAEAFLKEGALVTITGRTNLDVEGICRKNKNTFGHVTDLTNPSKIVSAIKQVIARFGKIDIIVANIGDGTANTSWQESLSTNLMSSINLAEAALPHLIKQQSGSIVFIGSIAGVEAMGAPITYSVGKSALISYSKNLARTVAKNGVRVNCISPGNIFFDGGVWSKKLKQDHEKFSNYIKNEVPMQRFGTPKEIANIVCFLSSNRASFVTGACIVADGGQTHVI